MIYAVDKLQVGQIFLCMKNLLKFTGEIENKLAVNETSLNHSFQTQQLLQKSSSTLGLLDIQMNKAPNE